MTPTYEALVEAIGETMTHRLIERLGGAQVYIPIKPIPGSQLMLALGNEIAQQLCDHSAGTILDLPSFNTLQSLHRRKEVEADLMRGLTPTQAARKHGLSSRHVRRIRESINA